MGIFASFSKGFNAGKERAENQSYRRNDLLDCPVELVEPSVGNVVEFKVTEKRILCSNIYAANNYICQMLGTFRRGQVGN